MTSAVFGRQSIEVGHICKTFDLRLQFSTTQINNFANIFFAAYAKAAGPCNYWQSLWNTNCRATKTNLKRSPYTLFGPIGQYFSKVVWQITQYPVTIQALFWPKKMNIAKIPY